MAIKVTKNKRDKKYAYRESTVKVPEAWIKNISV